MAELPFELAKNHKAKKKNKWITQYEMKIDEDDFDYVYNEYIHTTNCDLCKKLFTKSNDRHLDHNHKTGEVRNIVCNRCNNHRQDNKIRTDSCNERFISKCKKKSCKNGYTYILAIVRDGKQLLYKSSVDINKVIKFRDEFLKNNPDIFT